MEYCNYHKHTHYSNIFTPDTNTKVEDYCKRANELNHSVYFTVEHGYGGDIFKSVEMCEKYNLKCVFGIEGYIVENSKDKDKSNYHIIIIPKNDNARKKLNKATSHANSEGFYYKPRLFLEDLLKLNPNDFYITTACLAGILRDQNSYDKIFLPLYNHFKDNIFLEVQNHKHIEQIELNKKILDISKKLNLKIIHSNDSHYINPENSKDRQNFLMGKNINYGDEDSFILDYPDYNTIVKRYQEQGVLNKEEAIESINNTLIFKDIENININKILKIPNIYKKLTPNERMSKLKNIINKNFKEIRIKDKITKEEFPKYKKAILEEFKVLEETISIHTMDYFLLNERMVDIAVKKYNGILTTTGRGSAGAYYINRLLNITQLDRIRAKIPLYYERFLSPARLLENNSTADVDYNVANPEPFIKATKDLLGENGCKWMIAYGTMQEGESFRNLCRSKNIPFEEFNEIAKNIDKYREDEYWGNIIEECQKFIDVIVSMSCHPCANIVFDGDLEEELGVVRAGEFLCCPITSDEAETWKYLKNDYLTVSTVDITQKTFDLIGIPRMSLVELENAIDSKVWDIYEKGLTCTVNQIDSSFATAYAMRYKPKSISELAMLTGVIRPNFVDYREIFINRKTFNNECSKMDELFKSTENFIIFQENLMQFFEWLGVSPAESIGLIKKISKKKIKQKDFDILVEKLKINWEKENKTLDGFESTWQKIQSMISYGYNSPHALAMAYDSLYNAFLKAHYPLEYYTVVLNAYEGDKERTERLINESKYFNINLSAPKFRHSSNDYTINKSTNTIFKGVSSIKGISKDVGDKLNKLKDKQYNTFLDLLIDLKPNEIHISDVLILTKLNYFSEFGKIKSLLKYIDIFQQFYGAKTFKKDKEYLVKQNVIKQFCAKETEKQYSQFRDIEFLKYIWEKLPQKDLSQKEKISYELDYYGYIDTIDNTADVRLWVVSAIDLKGNNYITKLYNVNNGKEEICKIRKRTYQDDKIKKGDFILLNGFSKEGKRYKDGDEWKQSTEDFENILKNYRKV